MQVGLRIFRSNNQMLVASICKGLRGGGNAGSSEGWSNQ